MPIYNTWYISITLVLRKAEQKAGRSFGKKYPFFNHGDLNGQLQFHAMSYWSAWNELLPLLLLHWIKIMVIFMICIMSIDRNSPQGSLRSSTCSAKVHTSHQFSFVGWRENHEIFPEFIGKQHIDWVCKYSWHNQINRVLVVIEK